MKFVSIDIETTGLNEEFCQVLEFGAVIEDTANERPLDELPTFHAYLDHPVITGDPFALNMNAKIIERIVKKEPGYMYIPGNSPKLAWDFKDWLFRNGITGKVCAAGKNFSSFDQKFLGKLPKFLESVQFLHRSLDPAVLYLRPDDIEPPNMKKCMERAGIKGEVAHTAVEDAKMVIRLLRNKKVVLCG
jgi:oligoribonuclease